MFTASAAAAASAAFGMSSPASTMAREYEEDEFPKGRRGSLRMAAENTTELGSFGLLNCAVQPVS